MTLTTRNHPIFDILYRLWGYDIFVLNGEKASYLVGRLTVASAAHGWQSFIEMGVHRAYLGYMNH